MAILWRAGPLRWAVSLGPAAAMLLTACGHGEDRRLSNCPPAATGANLLDERTGGFRGVQTGDLESEVGPKLSRLHHGRDRGSGEALSRCGLGPTGGFEYPSRIGTLRLRDAALTFGGRPSRLIEVTSVGRGTRTVAGVRVGDPLSRVEERYGGVSPDCSGETGDDGPLWPSCRLRYGRIDLYFGGDPVNEIQIRDRAMARRP